jgi:multidrug resistance protein, MATE family
MYKKYLFESRKILRLGLPIVVGQLGIIAMGVADTIQVGGIPQIGKVSVGAAGVGNSIFITVGVLGMVALGVIGPMISKAKAENNFLHVRRLVRTAWQLALLLGAISASIIALVGYFMDLFKQPAEVSVLAQPYTYVIALSLIPQYLFIALRQLSDGFGKSQSSMWVILLAFFCNIFLNWCFIYGVGFFPKWGLIGAGVATLISRFFLVFCLFGLIWKDPSLRPFLTQVPGNYVALMRETLRVGIPAGLQSFFEIAVFSAAVIIIGWLGVDQQAGHLIAINMCSVSYMMVTGLAAAGGIRVGEAWGLRDLNQIRLVGQVALWLSALFMALCAIFMLVGGSWLVSLYTQDVAVARVALSLLMIGAFFQISDGVQATALGVLRGVADVDMPTGITLVAYWVIGLPLGCWLAFEKGYQAEGVWIGLTAGLTVSAGLLCWRFFKKIAQLKLT